jgi:multimeric flavodoxin WrbA
MKTVMINGSPKTNGSSSEWILTALRNRLADLAKPAAVCSIIKQSREEILDAVQDCDALIFAFPLYVDGCPSHLLAFLDEAQGDLASAAPGAKVYVLVNNGFYEARQNSIAIEMMKSLCAHSGLAWGCGVGIGAGGMIQAAPAGHGPMKNLGRTLDRLAEMIRDLKTSADLFVEPNFPRFLYILAAHWGWKAQAKKNHLRIRQLYKSNDE